jgi:phosphoribosyl 1,2-cyclic phosphate phosphodiesterase
MPAASFCFSARPFRADCVKLTFLGTGTSFGVPQLGCHCDVCRSPDPRDTRTRVGAVLESNHGTRLLIDTPPELRLQLIANGIDRVDAVLYTHSHADHTHGIDDLRAITIRRSAPLPIYGPAETLNDLSARFRYIFDDGVRPLPGTSKPEGKAHVVEPGIPFTIADFDIMAVRVPHGTTTVFAYRIGPLAYVTDAKSLPPGARGSSWRECAGDQCAFSYRASDAPQPAGGGRGRAQIGAERTYLTI